MRETGLKNGVLSHYLKKFEKNGIIKVRRTPRRSRFYPPHTSEEESKAIKALRRQTPRDLLLALMENGALGFKDLVKVSGKSPSTVSGHLSQMVCDGLIEIRFVDLKRKYHIKMKSVLDGLVEDYRPGRLEKPSAGLEDIINSL